MSANPHTSSNDPLAELAGEVRRKSFPRIRFGYDADQVDGFLTDLARVLESPRSPDDRASVQRILAQVRRTTFPSGDEGYAVDVVDAFITELAERIRTIGRDDRRVAVPPLAARMTTPEDPEGPTDGPSRGPYPRAVPDDAAAALRADGDPGDGPERTIARLAEEVSRVMGEVRALADRVRGDRAGEPPAARVPDPQPVPEDPDPAPAPRDPDPPAPPGDPGGSAEDWAATWPTSSQHPREEAPTRAAPTGGADAIAAAAGMFGSMTAKLLEDAKRTADAILEEAERRARETVESAEREREHIMREARSSLTRARAEAQETLVRAQSQAALTISKHEEQLRLLDERRRTIITELRRFIDQLEDLAT